MAINEIKTFSDIKTAIARRAGIDLNKTENVNSIEEKINTYYQKLSFRKHYRWSGATGTIRLRAKYTTGTVDVTNDSDEITGNSTVWTENAHLFSRMYIGSDPNPFKIIRVGSNTTATLDRVYTGDTDTAVSYTIYKDEYGLFPDLLNIRKIYIPGQITRWLNPTSPEDMDRCRLRSPFAGGLPQKYTLYRKNIYTEKTWANFNINFDFWEDDYYAEARNENLVVWPCILTTDTHAYVRYTMRVPPMDSDTDEPLVPYQMRGILVYGPLLDHFLSNRNIAVKREWAKEHKNFMSDLEADVETVDDELLLKVDRRGHKRRSYRTISDDSFTYD